MQEWKSYIHLFIVIALVGLAASLLWMLWPVIAALLVGIGIYLVVKFVLFLLNYTVKLGTLPALPEKKEDATK